MVGKKMEEDFHTIPHLYCLSTIQFKSAFVQANKYSFKNVQQRPKFWQRKTKAK